MVKRGPVLRHGLALRIDHAQTRSSRDAADAMHRRLRGQAGLLHGIALVCGGGKAQLVVVAARQSALGEDFLVKTSAGARPERARSYCFDSNCATAMPLRTAPSRVAG